ncbi:MAG: DUF599 family protein [Candidatus Bilamarchaeaceae archaeon]
MQFFIEDISTISFLDWAALLIFIICIILSIYLRDRARKMGRMTGKKIRSVYRRSWVKEMVAQNSSKILTDVVRNQIMVSTALLSALVISFGFVISLSNLLGLYGSLLLMIKIALVLILITYAFFMILLETRTLVYVPVAFNVDPVLIKKYEKMEKEDYVAKLLHESFDHFSNAIRAIFFAIAVIAWLYNTYFFIFIVLAFTLVMVREDYGERSEITLF